MFFQIFFQPVYKITPESLTLYQRLYWSWVSYWDSGHYVTIAKMGYSYPQQAFFPLWPLLIRTISMLGIPPFVISFFLSFIFGLTAFVLFYLLAIRLIGNHPAKYALVLFASFPSAMFLHAGYTEGLFLSLVLLSFLMLEKKLYWLSVIFAGFANMTRLAGFGITVTYLILKQPFFKKIAFIAISVFGLLLYILFLQIVFGNGFLFIDAQKSWCGSQGRCQLISPLIPLINYGQLVLIGWIKPNLSTTFIDWFFSVVFFIMLVPVLKKLKANYFIYSLVVILLPLFSSTVGMVRYVLVAFPVFFVIPLLVKNRIVFIILCLLLFLLELRFVALFTNRIWVA